MVFNFEEFLDNKIFREQYNNLVEYLGNKKVILYNTSFLNLVKTKCDLTKLNIIGVSDIELKPQDLGKKYCGFNIIPIEKIIQYNPVTILIMDFDRLSPIINLSNLLKPYGIEMLSVFTNPQKSRLDYIETHIVDHCNLKCKSCAVYSPIAPEKYENINDFENDFKELSKKIDVACLRLMGGEPLLHPEIHQFLFISRKYFPFADIHIVTNGILLPNMNEIFWKACNENKIKIDISFYPPFIQHQQNYIHLIKEKQANIGFINNSSEFFHAYFTKNYNNDIIKTHNSCWQNNCVNLRSGHLVTCAMACYSDYLNNYFNQNLPVERGINIHNSSGDEIIDYLKNPVELCAYCDLDQRSRKVQSWDYSKKDVSEWII